MLTVDLKHSALLLIEFQGEWLHEKGKLYHLFTDQEQFLTSLDSAKKILAAARLTEIHIVHSGLSYSSNYKELGHAKYGLRKTIPTHQTFLTHSNDHDTKLIREMVELYFKGTYQGDAEQLKRAFHPDAHITGSLNNQIYDWTLTDFINRVTTTASPATQGEKYDKEIIFLDKTNQAAMVKARVAVKDLIFTDYITLLKINGQWLIRNKSFTT